MAANNVPLGTVDEHVEPKNLLLKYARDPDQAATFNYASMAHNNHFFFEGLSKKKVAMPGDLLSSLKRSFSSYETLRREFISHAESMFGPGFVWLVARRSSAVQANKPAEYAILTTYLAGSPYPGAHYRRQTQDMNTQNESSAPVNSVGAMGRHSESAKGPELLGGFINEANLVPILCINTWEHVWLPDYSISGKKEYARRFWEKIDWEKVRERAHAAK